MNVRKIIIAIIMISSCSADLKFLSFITKFYGAHVKSLKNFFNLNEDHSDNEINEHFHEMDKDNWLNNRKKDDEMYQYEDYNTNIIQDSDEEVFTPLTIYEAEQEKRSSSLGFLHSILKLFGYHTSQYPIKNSSLSPMTISNKSNGLDVRLKSTYFTKMLLETMKSQFKLIYPGTLWCGGGTLARNNHDYGFFRRTDKCCWKHDSCPKYIAAGETWKNLENVGLFTRSHCECDRVFYTCLKRINSFISNKIGVTYFNLLRPQCFRKEYPIVSCLEKRNDNRCLNYVIDNNKPKEWQWFDNKIY